MGYPSQLYKTSLWKPSLTGFKPVGESGVWYPHFNTTNYITFDNSEIIPGNTEGFIEWQGVSLNSTSWVSCISTSSLSSGSNRVMLYDHRLYIDSVTVGNITPEDWVTLSDGNNHTYRVGRNATGTWYFNLDGINILSATNSFTGQIYSDSFGTEYQGTTSVPKINGYFYNVNMNNVILLPMLEGYTSSLSVTDATTGFNATYVNFTQNDFVQSI